MIGFILQALTGIFTIVFVVGVGFCLSKKGWFDEKTSSLFARLVTNVSLPCYVITGLTKNFTLEKLISLVPDLVLPAASVVLAMIIGAAVTRLLGVRRGRRGVFATNFFIANTMFIGLPVNLALFGDESIPSVMLYYVINTIFFWTFGVRNIIIDTVGSHESAFSLTAVKKLFTPPLLGFFLALLLIVTEVTLPGFLYDGLRYIGNLTTPLSLIFIGIEISKISLLHFKFEKDIVFGLIGRFVVCPLCVLVLVPFFSVSPISVKVFTMQAAMPAMTQMAIVAKEYGADSQYAAALSFITILFGLLVIPIYMTIVNVWF